MEFGVAEIAALVTVLGGIFAAIKWGKGTLRWFWHRVARYRPQVPRETVRILPQVRGHWWHMGSVAGEPAMQIVGDWYATNITGDPIRLLGARIVRPRKARVDGGVCLIASSSAIPPGATEKVRALFWVKPPILKEGQDLKATIVFIDQYGNEHQVRNALFKGPRPKEEKKKDESIEESIHAINDPIEKEIAAVLKTEIQRYKAHGRQVGGLGSVETKHDGETRRAIPTGPSIATSLESASINSEHAATLIGFYRSLATDEERERFVRATLKRLSRDTEYAPVGYLVLLILFRIGKLNEALDRARSDLQRDDAYGFSDVLRLLDGLLYFEHHLFSAQQLDDVEKFVETVDEFTFGIKDRLAAIRAHRLASRQSSK